MVRMTEGEGAGKRGKQGRCSGESARLLSFEKPTFLNSNLISPKATGLSFARLL